MDAAIQVEPITHSTFLTRGALHFDEGRTERALADYDAAVRLAETPDKPAAYGIRCYFLARVGRLVEAQADCGRSLSLAPRNAIGLNSRGYVYFKLGQYKESIADYDVLLGMPGRMPPALFTRGVAKLRLGDSSGEADINAAKELFPGVAEEVAKLGITP